jgi:hypothetical protein
MDRGSEVTEFGFYFIKASDLDTGINSVTPDIIKADPDHYVYSSVDGSAFYEADNNYVYSARFNEDIYTYQLDETIYVCFYYVDTTGRYVTSVASYKILTEVNKMIAGYENKTNSISELEYGVYVRMNNMYNAITNYRNTFDESERNSLDIMDAPTIGNSQFADFDFSSMEKNIYSANVSYQVILTEPWGLRINVNSIKDTTNGNALMSLSDFEDYGVLVLNSATDLETLTPATLLANENTRVFSSSNGEITKSGNMFYIRYNDGIYTYQLNTKLYFTVFVKINGTYYFRSVKSYTISDCVNEMQNALQAIENPTDRQVYEISVYQQMKDLYAAITEYREDYFAKHPDERE